MLIFNILGLFHNFETQKYEIVLIKTNNFPVIFA